MSSSTARIDSGAAVARVRFAPSPTGSLHVGGGRTALFIWLYAHGQAKRQGKEGAFLLRIEDTDQKRFVPGATEGIMRDLAWFGLDWQEGPDKGGPVGPYVQSERVATYQAHVDQLVGGGHAYRCFCSPERLARVREEQRARNEAPGYDRHCRNLSPAEVEAKLAEGLIPVVRFKMPREGETRFVDLLRGEIVFQNANLEDLVLLKSDGFPTYHLANVVDDHLMGITLITRAEEWIPSTPLHIRLFEAFGWEPPAIAHMPLILGPGGGKLSKRHGATAMNEFRAKGYLPEALMNYLALLGWSYDATTEIFSKEDLLEKFSLERVNLSPATFSYEKLTWFNQYYINHILTLDDVTARVAPFLAEAGLVEAGATEPGHRQYAAVRDAVALLKDRLVTLAEAPELMGYFLTEELAAYDPALLVPKKMTAEETLHTLSAAERALAGVDIEDETATEAALRALADELGLKAGQLFMPIRVAVTGRMQSPGLFETMRAIGDRRCRERLARAIASLREPAVATS
ncbi:MAG: glutamate--tRNA ligase [Thermomicrobiales bacterium]